MNDQQAIEKANELIEQNQFQEAEEICKKVLHSDSENIRAYNTLGRLATELKQYNYAIAYFNEAAKRAPEDANVIYNLAHVFEQMEDWDKAITCFRQSLQINPNDYQAIVCLADAYKKKEDYKEAEKYYKQVNNHPRQHSVYTALGEICSHEKRDYEAKKYFEKALKMKPKYAAALCGLVAIETRNGNIKKGENLLQEAIAQNQNNVEILYFMGFTLFTLIKYDEFLDIVKNLPKDNSPIYKETVALRIYELTYYYLMENIEEAERITPYLKIVESIPNETLYGGKKSRAYYRYVTKLLNFRKEHPELYKDKVKDNIHILGESHSLSTAHINLDIDSVMYKCIPHLIMGTKIWHLGDKKNNMYKALFKNEIKAIPEKSKIIVTFGEIDCRADEGIYSYCKKNNIEPEKHIKSMIKNYVSFVLAKAGKKNQEVIFCGVPAPTEITYSKLPERDRDDFLNIIKIYNNYLREAVKNKGCKFIDLYKMTSSKNGASNKKHHIDDYHIFPSSFTKAIKSYLS